MLSQLRRSLESFTLPPLASPSPLSRFSNLSSPGPAEVSGQGGGEGWDYAADASISAPLG